MYVRLPPWIVRCIHLYLFEDLVDLLAPPRHCRDFFFFQQKTACEMRISDWSSYVCSSDLALSQSLGVIPRPFLVAVMIAGSAAFATPFGYQTNVIVYQMGGYRYLDFVRVGLPLNLITFVVAVTAIHTFFPF